MTFNYYDAVVMGMEPGPLVAGALLSKKGYRILVVGQKAPDEYYNCLGYKFKRRPFLMTSAQSPAMKKVISELGLGQIFSQITKRNSPSFQIVTRNARVDIHLDLSLLKKEIKREFPESLNKAEKVLLELGRLDGEIDKLFTNNNIIPPQSFFEKRDFSRINLQNPFKISRDPLELFNLDKDFSDFLLAPFRAAVGVDSTRSALVKYRQIAGWFFNSSEVKNGLDGLRSLFIRKIKGLGGDIKSDLSICEIEVKRGRIQGVRIGENSDFIPCGMVLTDLCPDELSQLIKPSSWTRKFKEISKKKIEQKLGYSLNLGISPEAIPAGLAKHTILYWKNGLGDNLLRVERIEQEDTGKAAIHASCTVPAGKELSITSGALRDTVLDRLRWLIPFLSSHLEVIHSPFDGFGPIDFTGKLSGKVPAVPHADEISKWYIRIPDPQNALGIANHNYFTGINGLLLAGNQVISGLGLEGDMIAALSASKLATKMDPRRTLMLRSLKSGI